MTYFINPIVRSNERHIKTLKACIKDLEDIRLRLTEPKSDDFHKINNAIHELVGMIGICRCNIDMQKRSA